ncbi:hypothetical protein ACH5RR_017599 [Cinchona calisaya]|uniref:Uncharacterized protein n=1 Tax=Cinchona calisaya TaxID=153742 RepID=A0ABD2ZMM5_9GENT
METFLQVMKMRQVILDNGLVWLKISKNRGLVTGIKYAGMDNLQDIKSSETSRGYWDLNWNLPGGYILRSAVSGFYCYAIYERPPGCCAFDLSQTRMVFKLRQEKFHYMAITDEK